MVKIRKATEKDFAEIARILMKESSKEPYKDKYTKKMALENVKGLAKENIFVAVEEKEILGFIASNIVSNDKEKAYISELWLKSKYQGKGIGKSLVEFVEKLYKKKGVKKMRLASRKDSKAFGFYEKIKKPSIYGEKIMTKTDKVKGFQDFIGEDALKRKKILEIIETEYRKYGFTPAETPIIEFEEFVTSGNENDEAVRDVFKLKDRGDRELALRYEFTFQLKRIANKQKLPFKRYQIGTVFRDEPIKKGRSRQFIQCDADVVGSTVKDEAECLKMASNAFSKLGIPVTIYVNNRKLMNEILVDAKVDEKVREDVIREVDKLDKLPASKVAENLAELGAERVLDIFRKKEEYFEKYNFYREVRELKEYCKMYGVNVEFRPFLARGFSYYNGTVFEIWSKKLDVALVGGGSYLIDKIQATGISLGLEPIFLLAKVETEGPALLIVSLGQDKKVISLAESLRAKNIKVQTLMDKGLGKAMEYANSKGIKKVLVIGKEEVKPKAVLKIKNMRTGKTITITKTTDLAKKVKG